MEVTWSHGGVRIDANLFFRVRLVFLTLRLFLLAAGNPDPFLWSTRKPGEEEEEDEEDEDENEDEDEDEEDDERMRPFVEIEALLWKTSIKPTN